eukprot:gene29003-35975_t
MAEFTFVNIRERLVGQRVIAPAPTTVNSALSDGSLVQNQIKSDSDVILGSSIERIGSGSSIITSNSHIEDHYIIGDQIGSGMSGQVYFCLHRATSAQCAVKVIDTRKFVLTPGLSVSDLMEEAAIIQQLDHPNIIKVLSTFQTEHGIHIVMELLKGGDLFDRIVEKGRYTEAAARKIMRKILSAVSYLHSHNIIHRDLKPENILLVSTQDDTEIKLTDFGLAKKADQEGLKTFCGTPQYFAPEVLKRKSTVKGAGRYGPAADMWSLGVVLYILLSGTFPFDEDNLFDQINRANYSMSGSEWAGISVGAKHMVSSMLTLRPDKRITVTQALKHPWIQNITYNAAAFESETAKAGLYRGAASHARPAAPTQQQLIDSQGILAPSSKRRKSVKNVEPFAGSALQMSVVHSKPHISTLPLFMTNKKPSISAQSTSNANSSSQQQQQQQQSSEGPAFTTAGASSGMLDVYAELTGSSQAVGSLVSAVTHGSPTPSAAKFTSPLSTGNSKQQKTSRGTPQSTNKSPGGADLSAALLSGDEIEDCSSSGGEEEMGEDGEVKKLPNKPNKVKGAKSDKADRKRKRPDIDKVRVEPVPTSTSLAVGASISSPVVIPTKKQRSLEDSWRKPASNAVQLGDLAE